MYYTFVAINVLITVIRIYLSAAVRTEITEVHHTSILDNK